MGRLSWQTCGVTHGVVDLFFWLLFKKFFPYQMAGLKGLSILRNSFIRVHKNYFYEFEALRGCCCMMFPDVSFLKLDALFYNCNIFQLFAVIFIGSLTTNNLCPKYLHAWTRPLLTRLDKAMHRSFPNPHTFCLYCEVHTLPMQAPRTWLTQKISQIKKFNVNKTTKNNKTVHCSSKIRRASNAENCEKWKACILHLAARRFI